MTPGTFVSDLVTVLDDYGNILNGVQIRYESSEDPVTDADGREVFGLLVRTNGVADNTTVGANPVENLEICFVVNVDGVLTLPNGGVTGTIDFNVNRVFAERRQAKIALEGGNAIDMDVLADITVVHYSDYTVTTAFAAGETLNLTTGAGATGASTRGGDTNAIALNSSSVLFVADNTAKCTENGVKGTKGAGKDFDRASANTVTILKALDIGDVIGIERKY